MRRPLASALALALVVLLSASPARAVMITGYAEGVITDPRSVQTPGLPPPYFFVLGESVSVRYTYDNIHPPIPRAGFTIATSGGYTFTNHGGLIGGDVQQGPGSRLLLGSAAGTWAISLSLPGGDGPGRLEFHNDRPGFGWESFAAAVTRAPDPLHAPEPGGLAMGVVGAGLVAFTRWRKRR